MRRPTNPTNEAVRAHHGHGGTAGQNEYSRRGEELNIGASPERRKKASGPTEVEGAPPTSFASSAIAANAQPKGPSANHGKMENIQSGVNFDPHQSSANNNNKKNK